MKNKRRDFIRLTGLTGLGMASGMKGFGFKLPTEDSTAEMSTANLLSHNTDATDEALSIIGPYGKWAASLTENQLPSFSFRRKEWSDANTWREAARKKLVERLGLPDVGKTPTVKINKQFNFDGLHIEEVTWQLPYGRPTEAVILKPANSSGKLPGILAFHDHGGNKYLGTRKIIKTSEKLHPVQAENQQQLYEGLAWANEIAKRGYVVLVSDAFTFGSRRVMIQDVPERLRQGISDPDDGNAEQIAAYNSWAGQHEHIMAKSLFSAGTTWPGVFFAEDQKALDVLCARPDVDTSRIGCGGLSGGGLRTVMMGGLDPRIKCAVCVGFMSTWKDFLMHKSFTHTWMTYVPILPKELDFPEILGLRAPLSTLVLNDSEDQLFTLTEMRRADQILGDVFKKAGGEDRYKCSFHPGPHKFDAKMQAEAFDWFDKWLKQ